MYKISYFLIFYFLISNIHGECLEFSYNSVNSIKQTCEMLISNHKGFQKCLKCSINRPMIPLENITIAQNCSPVFELQCVEFDFNDTQTFLDFSHQYWNLINKLFDKNISVKKTSSNALFINIAYDSLDVLTLQTIQSFETISNRNFNGLRLVMRNRGNRTKLYIDSNIQNTTFRVLQIYIHCGDIQGWNVYNYVHHSKNKQQPNYIECQISTTTLITTTQLTTAIRHTTSTTYTLSTTTTTTTTENSRIRTSSTTGKTTTTYILSSSTKNLIRTSTTTNKPTTTYILPSTTKHFKRTSSTTHKPTTTYKLSSTTKKLKIPTSSITNKPTTTYKLSSTTKDPIRTSTTTHKPTTTYTLTSTTENLISTLIITTTEPTTTYILPSTTENLIHTSSTTYQPITTYTLSSTTENIRILTLSTTLETETQITLSPTKTTTTTTTIVDCCKTEQSLTITLLVTMITKIYSSSKSIKSTKQNESKLTLILSLVIIGCLLLCLLVAFILYMLRTRYNRNEERQLSTSSHIIDSITTAESGISSKWIRSSF